MPDTERATPYVLLPQRLCIDLRDSPVAIGVYALIARLFLVSHEAIPLSAGDIERFDQQTSYGQARRALERLTEAGWVLMTALGRKNAYLPTWGVIAGAARPWCFGADKFGRPPHIRTYRLEAFHLDTIARVTPHPRLTSVIARGGNTATLAMIGEHVLEAASLLTHKSKASKPEIVAESDHALFFEPANSIDQLIPHVIGQPEEYELPHRASRSAINGSCAEPQLIPWESWDKNQSINKQASSCDQDDCMAAAELSQDRKNSISDMLTAIHDQLHLVVQLTHEELNAGRMIAPGEWWELIRLQRTYGVEQLLVWQARAARRQVPIAEITPAYYDACAANAVYETFSGQQAFRRLDRQQKNPETPEYVQEAAQQGSLQESSETRAVEHASGRECTMPTGQVAEQLRSLGIRVLAGLEDVDPCLVESWVQASTNAGWSQLWDDPGAAARALLLRGEPPPSPVAIRRRAQAAASAAPVSWADIQTALDGLARLGDDLTGLSAIELPAQPTRALPREQAVDQDVQNVLPDYDNEQRQDEPVEELRCRLRLHTTSRLEFQIVERLRVEIGDDVVVVRPGRAEDLGFVRQLLPIIAWASGGRQVMVCAI